MKLLLDACVWGGSKVEIAAAGHDIVYVGDWEKDPGDEEVLAVAFREGRILVTIDKDFGELVIVRGQPHAGILRIVEFPGKQQAGVCLRVLGLHGEELSAGALVVAERGRVRVRPPEKR